MCRRNTSFYQRLLSSILVVVAAYLTCSTPALSASAGRDLVEANCSRCHAIDTADSSQHPAAPAFRDLHERYPLDALEEAFVEGIYVGHPDMPEFIATPQQTEAIIDYIQSLSR